MPQEYLSVDSVGRTVSCADSKLGAWISCVSAQYLLCQGAEAHEQLPFIA